MNTKIYTDGLPSDAKKIREEVFIVEQGFQNEIDETDTVAAHIVLYDPDEVAVATCRVFWDHKLESYMIGRLAVRRECRGKNVGANVLRAAEEYICSQGGHRVTLHSQCRASEFYRKQGYISYGEIEDDEGCPHIWMRKQLTPSDEAGDKIR